MHSCCARGVFATAGDPKHLARMDPRGQIHPPNSVGRSASNIVMKSDQEAPIATGLGASPPRNTGVGADSSLESTIPQLAPDGILRELEAPHRPASVDARREELKLLKREDGDQRLVRHALGAVGDAVERLEVVRQSDTALDLEPANLVLRQGLRPRARRRSGSLERD